jgi:hypothetical protein
MSLLTNVSNNLSTEKVCTCAHGHENTYDCRHPVTVSKKMCVMLECCVKSGNASIARNK